LALKRNHDHMKKETALTHKFHRWFSGIILAIHTSSKSGLTVQWLLFLTGLMMWIGIQGALMVGPLWTRALPPEVDDSLTYVLKSKQMEECFYQNCPALIDLTRQLHRGSASPQINSERWLASSRIFPVYHPLLSVIMVGLNKLGFDWITTYKVIWSVGPVFLGLAFAYFLAALWGLPVAGLALALLAFKVFPHTGLHRIVPSNLAMGMAMIIWGHILFRKKSALWIMGLGSLLMIAMHPIGLIYTLMALCLALLVSGHRPQIKGWIPIMLTLLIMGIAFISFTGQGGFKILGFQIFPKGGNPFIMMGLGAVENAIAVMADITRLQAGLLGSVPLFFGALALGIWAAPPERRSGVVKMFLIYVLFLFGFLFYMSSHPGDVIFRMWIPFVVLLFGAIGQAIWYVLQQTWRLLISRLKNTDKSRTLSIQEIWPVLVLAVLVGYSFQMAVRGTEQIIATTAYMKNRQPLMFVASQPELLLSKAKPGDRVLYTSMMAMPYYFIHGAMRLGAVYYHPVMKEYDPIRKWLSRPDLRFAVAYNPTVYHPSFEGLPENQQCYTSPAFHFSPLNAGRIHGPISREGKVPANHFRWIEVAAQETDVSQYISIWVNNPGHSAKIKIIPVEAEEKPDIRKHVEANIPPHWSGRIRLDLGSPSRAKHFKILLPQRKPGLLIGGVVFGNDPLHWPWAQRADLTFMPRNGLFGPMTLSFDPADILPAPLNKMKISVLDDNGSTVLFQINR